MHTVTFIHAKGADSNKPNRHLSVSAYEIVVSQAVKNLRHLDPEIRDGRFLEKIDARIDDAVWLNGNPTTRQAMLGQLTAAGTKFKRRVIVLQPHTRQSELTPSAASGSRAGTRAAQLHTLLLAAQVNCRALGADFTVIADKT